MNVGAGRAAELEWANYAASLPAAQASPDLEIVLREDVILTASAAFPLPDANHACLLRTDASGADALIDEIVTYFCSRSLPATVYLSPACSPADLTQRLVDRGLVRQGGLEAWMVLEPLGQARLPRPSDRVAVTRAHRVDALTVAQTFMAAFGMPTEFAEVMAQLLGPSIELEGVAHYLAWVEGHAVGTCSLLCTGPFGVLGSAGVLPGHRGRLVVSSLVVRAVEDAIECGVETLMLQTEADGALERLLRIYGFKRAFARICLTLP